MNDLACKPNFNLLLLFTNLTLPTLIYASRLCFVNKDGVGVNDLQCKPNFNLLWSRDVNSPRLCFVNKDGVGVNDLHCKPNFNLLLSRGVNSPGYVLSTKMAAG